MYGDSHHPHNITDNIIHGRQVKEIMPYKIIQQPSSFYNCFNRAIVEVQIRVLVCNRDLPHRKFFRFEKDFGFYLSHEKTPSTMISDADTRQMYSCPEISYPGGYESGRDGVLGDFMALCDGLSSRDDNEIIN
jgi:hypothetical protein